MATALEEKPEPSYYHTGIMANKLFNSNDTSMIPTYWHPFFLASHKQLRCILWSLDSGRSRLITTTVFHEKKIFGALIRTATALGTTIKLIYVRITLEPRQPLINWTTTSYCTYSMVNIGVRCFTYMAGANLEIEVFFSVRPACPLLHRHGWDIIKVQKSPCQQKT